MRGGRGTEQQSRTDQVWRFCAEKKEQTQHDIRSKTFGCDAVLGEENVTNSDSEGSQRHGVSTDMETKQRQVSSENSIEEQQTWWQTQSSLCGTPNGISYELDKNRANRIKSLGNSIVPLIARELGLAIIKAETHG